MKRLGLLFLTLLLAAVLGVTAAAAAPAFTDSDRISNTGAVEMLCDLGVAEGYPDGSFRPRSTITRQAAVKMVTCILTDDPQPASGAVKFSDVPADSAFAPYIYYCAGRGIVSGSGGEFRPSEPITARALAKILLGILGYDTSGYTGAGWAGRVDADAWAAGIYDGFYDYLDQPVTRDNACLLIFNALQSYAIESYDAGGNPVYCLDDLMNPQTLLEYRYGVVRYTELLIANEYADMTVTDGRLEEGYSQLEHHRALPVSTGLEMLGRNIVLYARGGEVVGVPTYSPYEGYYTFDNFEDFADVLTRVNMTLGDNTKCYYNYNSSTRLALARAGENVEITIVDHTGDGVLDLVLMVEYLTAAVVSTADGLTAQFESGEPFAVTAGAAQIETLAEGDSIEVAFIGGRWLLKGA